MPEALEYLILIFFHRQHLSKKLHTHSLTEALLMSILGSHPTLHESMSIDSKRMTELLN